MKRALIVFTGLLAFVFFLMLTTGCKKPKSAIGEHPEKMILGEWFEGSLTFEGDKKLFFEANNTYQVYFRGSSSAPWELQQDSLKYTIQNGTIFLEDELLPPQFHKITHLDEAEFHYEVIQPDGHVSLRLWRR